MLPHLRQEHTCSNHYQASRAFPCLEVVLRQLIPVLEAALRDLVRQLIVGVHQLGVEGHLRMVLLVGKVGRITR